MSKGVTLDWMLLLPLAQLLRVLLLRLLVLELMCTGTAKILFTLAEQSRRSNYDPPSPLSKRLLKVDMYINSLSYSYIYLYIYIDMYMYKYIVGCTAKERKFLGRRLE